MPNPAETEEFNDLLSRNSLSEPDRLWTEVAAAKATDQDERVKELARRLLLTEKDDVKRAKLFSLRGDVRNALKSLEAATHTQKLTARIEVRNSHYFDAIRQLPDYRDLLGKMKLN